MTDARIRSLLRELQVTKGWRELVAECLRGGEPARCSVIGPAAVFVCDRCSNAITAAEAWPSETPSQVEDWLVHVMRGKTRLTERRKIVTSWDVPMPRCRIPRDDEDRGCLMAAGHEGPHDWDMGGQEWLLLSGHPPAISTPEALGDT